MIDEELGLELLCGAYALGGLICTTGGDLVVVVIVVADCQA